MFVYLFSNLVHSHNKLYIRTRSSFQIGLTLSLTYFRIIRHAPMDLAIRRSLWFNLKMIQHKYLNG